MAVHPCREADHQVAYQAWRWGSPSAAGQQDHHTQQHLEEAEEADPHLMAREVATGCTVEAACQAGFEVAGQIRPGLVDWDDGEGHHWGTHKALREVARNLVRRAGSCRMVFAVRWEVDGRLPILKVRLARLLA